MGRSGCGRKAGGLLPQTWQTRRCAPRYRVIRIYGGAFESKQGIRTSSGVLEAGCKVAIGTRLKRSGMHWTLNGANNIIALRCCRLSGRFEDFWERRNQPIAA